MTRYISPYTDFGFKKLFGEEANKDLLIDFLNQLLPPHHQIKALDFRNPENLPELLDERKAFFDIHCEAVNGEKFIVEMQKAKMKYFKDRSLFYVSFPIKEQAPKGIWNFRLTPIYFVAILDFEYDESEERLKKFRRDVSLKDQDGDVFYDKLHFKFLQMPLFNKKENELENRFDKWCYFLKNLESFEHIPAILNEEVFQKAFKTAELANLSPKERERYERSRLRNMEIETVVTEAKEEAKQEGIQEGRKEGIQEGVEKGIKEGLEKGIEKGMKEALIQTAKKMKANGIDIQLIMEMTGLDKEEIEKL